LPDKAVSVLDTAAARVALGQMTTPPVIEDCQRRIAQIDTEIGILERESLTGANLSERLGELAKEKAELLTKLAQLQQKWAEEKEYVDQLREIRTKLEAHAEAVKQGADANAEAILTPDEVKRLQGEIARLNEALSKVQGDTPLLQVCVDAQAVAEVVSGWTGIPVGKVVKDEIQTVLSLRERLEERIIGQSHALEAISQRIRTARAKLEDPRRPIGVFMLVGPSGVGKTETALTLADVLFGGERNLITINMSEYQESHTVSGLKGSPPGYVGYGEGGVLTEAVRRKPYSVVLLDEMEKAHTDVMELFYQVFDKGMLEDGEGREIDFKNTLILMTSNAGTDTFMKLCADPETRPELETLAEALRPDLLKVFKPAFLGRAIVVPYYPIADDVMRKIIELQLGRIQKRLFENHRAEFSYDPALVDEVASRCTEVESGGRNVDHILTRTLLPEISWEFLARMANGEAIARVHVSVGDRGQFQYQIS
jgi:type VI secretion system protein VasG